MTLNNYPIFAIDISQNGTTLSTQQSQEIDNFINHIDSITTVTKTELSTIEETISCVDILKQPGLSHIPKNTSIQLQPSSQLAALLPGKIKPDNTPTSCPDGSIEMKLPTREKIVNSGSLKNFFSKYPKDPMLGMSQNIDPSPSFSGHEYAVYTKTINAIGAQSTINIWKPTTESSDMSISQLWLAGGTGYGLQTAEVGYQVLPMKYGDHLPHLFIYYTADGYHSTGCYNLDCGQFIKTSNILNIGGVLPSSTLSGAQIEGTLAFYRDPATGNWILFFVDSAGNYIQSGYYPASTYGSGQLSHYTQFIEFGGEIYAPVPAATSTDMGSGKFSSAGYGQSAYQRNIKHMDVNNIIQNFMPSSSSVTQPSCYTLTLGTNPSWGSSFYFGGPGCI